MKKTADEILTKSAQHIKDRAASRDMPEGERSMKRCVEAFNAQEGTNLTEAQGWRFLVQLKYARAVAGAFNIDDYEDLSAYSALAAECLLGDESEEDVLIGGFEKPVKFAIDAKTNYTASDILNAIKVQYQELEPKPYPKLMIDNDGGAVFAVTSDTENVCVVGDCYSKEGEVNCKLGSTVIDFWPENEYPYIGRHDSGKIVCFDERNGGYLLSDELDLIGKFEYTSSWEERNFKKI